MAATDIEWTDVVWNPVRGCSIVSPGCHSCYAMRTAHRFDYPGGTYEGLTKPGPHGPVWSGKIRLVEEKLTDPLHWGKSKRVFVNSMSDLFHDDVPDSFIEDVFCIMARSQRHTFQVLTKRAERLPKWFATLDGVGLGNDGKARERGKINISGIEYRWPLPNVWLGVSCEDQQRADERIPHLLKVPAAVRFLSVEPMLGKIDLRPFIGPHCVCDKSSEPTPCDAYMETGRCPNTPSRIGWAIAGGESGPGARPCFIEDVRLIVMDCQAAGVPVFVKQLGSKPRNRFESTFDCGRVTSKGGNPFEWPADLRVREFPKPVTA